MTKKKQVIYAGNFLFFYIKQYQNIASHQLSMHVTLKLHKRSVMRHLIKRAVMDYVQKHDLIKKSLDGHYYKFFVMLNKNALPQWQKQIENVDRKTIITYAQREFANAWKILESKLK